MLASQSILLARWCRVRQLSAYKKRKCLILRVLTLRGAHLTMLSRVKNARACLLSGGHRLWFPGVSLANLRMQVFRKNKLCAIRAFLALFAI